MQPVIYKNAEISYTESGGGSITLLFVHGSFIDKEYWKSQVEYFRTRYKIITIDLPGHGQSTSGTELPTTHNFGKALNYFINELDLHDVVLIGHSMGADVILEAATKSPSRLIGFVVIDYFKSLGKALPDEIKQQVLSGLQVDSKKTVQTYLETGLTTPETPKTVLQRVVKDYVGFDPEAASKSIADQFEYTNREVELIKMLSFKIYLINVDYTPTDTQALENLSPLGYELQSIHGTSHFPMIENPIEFNEALQSVINKIGR